MNKLLAILLVGVSAAHAAHHPSASGKKVILMIAQSNGMGTAHPEYAPNSRLDFTTARHSGPFYIAGAQLLRTFSQWDLVMVDGMAGGSELIMFEPSRPRYRRTLLKAKRFQNEGAEIVAIFFYQGESNARNNLSLDWPERFKALISQYRKDLHSPDLPVVWAQLGVIKTTDKGIAQNWKHFKQLQEDIQIPSSQMVKTEDQPVIDDVHHGALADQAIGERFAQAYLNLIAN